MTDPNFKKNNDNHANLVLLVGGISIGALIAAVLFKYDGIKENDGHKIDIGKIFFKLAGDLSNLLARI